MCCSEAFWKRVFVFGLTFGLGIFVAGLFVAEKPPASVKPALIAAPPETKNCVPVENDLKYERLTTEKSNVSPAADNLQLKAKKSEINEKSQKPEKEKLKKPAAPQPFNPSKDSAEVKYLVHREQCFETREQ